MEQIGINNIGKKLNGIQMSTGAFGKIFATDSFMDPKNLSNKSKTAILPVIRIQPFPNKKAS